MKLFREMYTFMAPGERRLFWISLVIRTALVLLDILGLGLLGISVSIASGTKFIGSSITGHIFSWLNSFTSNNAYAVVAGLSILFFVLKGGLSIALNFAIARGLARYQYQRASRLFNSILKSRLETLEKWSPSDYSYGLGGALDDVFGRLFSSISTAYGEVILMLGIAGFLIYTSPILFLILALFFALVGWVLYASSTRRVRIYAKKLTEATILSGNTVLDTIANFRQVSTSSSVDGLTEVFTHNRRVMAINQEKITTFSGLPRYIMEMAMMLGIGLLVIQRSTSLAQSVSASVIAIFIGGSLRLAASLLPLQGAFAMLNHIGENAKMPLEMLREFGTTSSEFTETRKPVTQDQAFELELENVSYSYPGANKEALSGVSFSAKTGDFVAIVGPSGAGKSTVADIILGLRVPSAGQVLVNGTSPESLRIGSPGLLAYVPQRTSLVQGSLAQNIALGVSASNVDHKKISKVLKLANLEKVVEQLSDGINTKIGSNGGGLSGGQIQRIGLARALYSEPKILILDEATSALDEESELAVQDAIDALSSEIAVIVIAHRLSTLRNANKIIRVLNGKSKQFTTFDELKASNDPALLLEIDDSRSDA